MVKNEKQVWLDQMFNQGTSEFEIAKVAFWDAHSDGFYFWGDEARVLLEDLISIARRHKWTMENVRFFATGSSMSNLYQALSDNNARSSSIINAQNEQLSEKVKFVVASVL